MATSKDIAVLGSIMRGALPFGICSDNRFSANEIRLLQIIMHKITKIVKTKLCLDKSNPSCPAIQSSNAELEELCNVSAPTLRSMLSNLLSLNVINIGYDPNTVYYFISFNPLYFNIKFHLKTLEIDPSNPSTLKELLSRVYEVTNKEFDYIVNMNELQTYYKTSLLQKVVEWTTTTDDYYAFATTKAEGIKRVPIINPENVKRVPIIMGASEKAKLKYEQKLKELEGVKSVNTKVILDIIKYYEYKSRQVMNTTGFKVVSTNNPEKHRNWNYFVKLFQLCSENNWDYRIYLDSQFDRASFWSHTIRPFPNQLYGTGAQEYYKNYVKRHKEEHEYDGIKLKGHNAKSVRQEIIETIIKDCEFISINLKRKPKTNPPEVNKTDVLFDNWSSLSPYYLSSCDWLLELFEEYTKEGEENYQIQEINKKLDMIKKSKSIQETIKTTISEIEKHYELPKTQTSEEIMASTPA
jgi:hypothetical protein